MKAVLKGQYTAGAVRDSVARKYIKLGIAVIAESASIPTGPLVASPGTPTAVIENIKKALLDLDPGKADGQRVLKRLDEDFKNGFTEATDKDYAEAYAFKNQCYPANLRYRMPSKDKIMNKAADFFFQAEPAV